MTRWLKQQSGVQAVMYSLPNLPQTALPYLTYKAHSVDCASSTCVCLPELYTVAQRGSHPSHLHCSIGRMQPLQIQHCTFFTDFNHSAKVLFVGKPPFSYQCKCQYTNICKPLITEVCVSHNT